jgi:hypothetical protein
MIVLQLAKIERSKTDRPRKYPYCGGETFQRWGGKRREIKDMKIRRVTVFRYLCTSCRGTFRHYPKGISRAQQSERIKQLAVICWSFGLSHRGVEAILSVFGVRLSRVTSWRDVQAGAEQIRREKRWQPARVVGVDGAWMRGAQG